MKTVAILSAAVIALTSSVWTFRALAQTSGTTDLGPPKMMDRQTWMERMRHMGMSDAMMSRCRMMRMLEVSAYDPAGVLALKEELHLNENQVRKLQTLLKASRDGAMAVLKEGQKQQLQDIDSTPASVMQMHHHMMGRMQDKMKDKGWTHQRMMCPMHMMMGPMMMDTPAAGTGSATQPAQNMAPSQTTEWGCCGW